MHLSTEHPWSSLQPLIWSDSLNTNALFVNYVCVGVCPWLSVNWKNNTILSSGLPNLKWFILLLLILKYILNQILLDFYSSRILLGDFYFYLSHFLLRYLYFYSGMTVRYFFHNCTTVKSGGMLVFFIVNRILWDFENWAFYVLPQVNSWILFEGSC